MKKLLTLITLSIISFSSNAQVGAVAPNFTQADINGTTHDLYTYLNAGKVVIVVMSATWCGPCWSFHTAHYLKDLYTEFGPGGTNQAVILFYEDDVATTLGDLNGLTGGTQGDWVTGSPYPIINATQTLPSQYGAGYPTVSVICPSDKKIKSNLAALGNLNAMRTVVQNAISTCSPNMVEDKSINNFDDASISPNPIADIAKIQFNMKSTQSATARLFNAMGQIISVTNHNLLSGSNTIEVDLSGYSEGTYFVQMSTKDAKSKMLPIVKASSR